MKEKIERALKMPKAVKEQMIGAEWLTRLENLPTDGTTQSE